MATEIIVVLAVVVPDGPPDMRARIDDLAGRELPGVPGSWVSRVAVHRPGRPTAARPAAEQAGDGLTDDERDAELAADFGVLDADS